jgi:hypothetical protein
MEVLALLGLLVLLAVAELVGLGVTEVVLLFLF